MIRMQKFTDLLLLLIFAFAFVQGQDSTESRKKVKGIAAIPMINYNRTQGIVLGAIVSNYFKMNKKDTISPSSNIGIAGIYTEQKSYALFLYSTLFFDEDRWRVKVAAGTLDINFQFYLEDPVTSTGNFSDYSTKANLVVLQLQRNILKRIYFGPTASFIKSSVTFSFPGANGQDSVQKNNLNSLGYIFSNDTRDHVQYPTKGMFLNFKNQFYGSWIGSDYDFVRYIVTYNQFFNLSKSNDKHILVARATLNIATGNVPFEGQTVVGGDDIRGYSQGKYRNDQVYTLQTEYRLNFYRKWGLVAFAGIATAVANFSDIFHTELLPGVGAGLRYRMLPSEKVNIGVDAGIGRGDYSITFRIGEAFGR
jgi:outer membrane protein assembly factor BamA